MAQLKDSVVAGNLRVTDKVLANGVQTNVINAPTASGGTTYGPGTNGQVLKSNGTTVYWTSDNNSDTKNTAGTTNKTGTKMFIAAATEQSANPVTYSNSNVYIGTDNCLYSGGTKVLTAHQDISGKVTGPASATNNAVAIFDGTGGKTIKNSGFTIGTSVPSGALFTDTNTHRPIQVNGTEVLGNNTTALNLKAGSNVSVTNSSGTVTIAATDTTYESKAAASGGTAVSLVTTGEKYTWNNKSNLAIGTTASTAMAGNTTVTNVAISANTTTNANYPVVFATSNTGTTAAKNEGVQKSGAKFYFNPSTGALNTGGTINGVDLANVVTDAGYQVFVSGTDLGPPENKAMSSLVKKSAFPHQMCYYSTYIHEEAVVSAAAGSWTTATPPTQTISVTGIGNIASSLVEVGLASTATSEEIDAAAAAKIMCTAQDTGSITLTCYGTTPTINIPILVVNWG